MSLWSKGNGPIKKVESEPQQNKSQVQESVTPADIQSASLSGPIRVWTTRHAEGIQYPDGRVERSYRYPLVTGGGAKEGDVMIDAHFGYTGKDGDYVFHAWDSCEPGVPLDVDTLERRLKRNINYHFRGKSTIELAPALRPYFNEHGDFIGKDRNMKFRVEGHADQLTKWLFAEMGYDD